LRQFPDMPCGSKRAARCARWACAGIAAAVAAFPSPPDIALAQNTIDMPKLRGTSYSAPSSIFGTSAVAQSSQPALAPTFPPPTTNGPAGDAQDQPFPTSTPDTDRSAQNSPGSTTPVEAQVRRPVGLAPKPSVHSVVEQPVYTATSPDRIKRQDKLPPRPGGYPGTADHPPIAAPVDQPVYTDAEEKRLAAHKRELRDADPYAPLGLRVGNLYVFPSIEQGLGYDTNPGQVQGGKGSAVSRTDGEVKLQSDWSSDSLTADLRGGYSYFPNVKSANRPDGDGKIDYRLDVSKDLNFLAEGRGTLTTEQPNSVNLPVATQSRPLAWTYGSSLQSEYHPGFWDFTLRGNVDRTEYGDATLADGTILDQSARDYTQYGLRARLGYDITPGVKPFVEARVDTIQYDQTLDLSGFARSSNGFAALVGTAFEFTRTLTGSIAVGYAQRDYDDWRLRNVVYPPTEASLVWSATPLTTITLKGTTQFVETTLAGSPGAVEHQIGLEVSHALFRNLIITGTANWTRDNYVLNIEHDTTWGVGIKAEWKLTRNMSIKASFLHTQESSNVPGRAFGENTYLVGMRVQY
jgi:hypothetical protein